jgi:hypothetical protein
MQENTYFKEKRKLEQIYKITFNSVSPLNVITHRYERVRY